MNSGPWSTPTTYINNTSTQMRKEGCAVTGMSNILTTAKSTQNGAFRAWIAITPSTINAHTTNFQSAPNGDNIDWNATAQRQNMGAIRSRVGDSDAAQQQLMDANNSVTGSYALVQVPITTSEGTSKHWVGVNGSLVDLKGDGNLWVPVSPTSTYDDKRRTNNENWSAGSDGTMYVKKEAVTGTVTVIPNPDGAHNDKTHSSDYY